MKISNNKLKVIKKSKYNKMDYVQLESYISLAEYLCLFNGFKFSNKYNKMQSENLI